MEKTWRDTTEKISIWIVAAFFIFFVALTAFEGLGESYISWDHFFERLNYRPQDISETIFKTIMFFIIYIALGFGLCKLSKVVNEKIIVGFFMLLSFGIALTWVLYGKIFPQADPYMAYIAALELYGEEVPESFIKYATIYKQQFGLISLYHFLFWFTGKLGFQVLQITNAIAVPFIVLLSFKITKKLTDNPYAPFLSLLIVGSCIPMYLYTTYAYGETLSILFSLLIVYIVTEMFKSDNSRKKTIFLYVSVFVCSFLAVMVRMNTLVVIIAVAIVAFIRAVTSRKYLHLLVVVMLFLGVISENMMINIRYKDVLKDNPSMPSVLWIAMGMQDSVDEEDYIGPGAYNSLNWDVFVGTDYNVDLSVEIAHLCIDARLKEFAADPFDMLRFYHKKFMIQWNVPIFQSIFMNGQVYDSPNAWAYDWIHTAEVGVANDRFMEIFHSMAFFGALFALIGLMSKKRRLEDYMIAVIMVGGFLFSLLWEAKPRYVYPYFVIMLTYSALGTAFLAEFAGCLAKKGFALVKSAIKVVK